jgi:hypothetical protein
MSVYRFLTLCGTVALLLILASGNNSAQQPALQRPTPLPEAIEKPGPPPEPKSAGCDYKRKEMSISRPFVGIL